jgi:DNA-binding transcriptional MerR regulator
MINPTRSSTPISERSELRSREIQLFEPPADAFYTIEATSRIVDVPRRRILVYCKYHLLSPATNTTGQGYYFDRDGIRVLRRIEALRAVCGDDFAGIRIILDLTASLERLRSDIRLLSRTKGADSWEKNDGEASPGSPRRFNVRSSSRRKRN